MSFQKRQAYFSKALNAQRGKEQILERNYEHESKKYTPTSRREAIPDLQQIQWFDNPSPSKPKKRAQKKKQKARKIPPVESLPDLLNPRENKNGVAWVIDETSINQIPQFKKEFRTPSPQSSDASRYSSPESVRARMPSRSRRSPSPPSPPAQRSGKLLKPQAKETKTSALRAQLSPNSRATSPQPISRSQSPVIPDLPGKRKDYSKNGKVSQYSQYFSRKKLHEKEERKKKEEDLRKARSQYYGEDDSDDDQRTKEAPSRASRRANRSPTPDSERSVSRNRRTRSESPISNGRNESVESDRSNHRLAVGRNRRGSIASQRSRKSSGASIASKRSVRKHDSDDPLNDNSENETKASRVSKAKARKPMASKARGDSDDTEHTDPNTDSDADNRKIAKISPKNKKKMKHGGAKKGSDDTEGTDPNTDSDEDRKRSKFNSSNKKAKKAPPRKDTDDDTEGTDPNTDSDEERKRSKSRVEKKENDYIKAESPRYGKGWGFGGGVDSAKSTGRDSGKSRRSVSRMANDSGKSQRNGFKNRDNSADSDKSARKSVSRKRNDSGKSQKNGLKNRDNSADSDKSARFKPKKNALLDDDDDDEENDSKTTSNKMSSADRHKRRMSYVPPKYRRNAVNKTLADVKRSTKDTKDKSDLDAKTMSALSRKSVRNFDDKKYKSNSHLTPVDW